MDAPTALYANIFFVSASIAAGVFVIGFGALLYFALPLVRDAQEVMGKFKAASKEVEKDFKQIKKAIKS